MFLSQYILQQNFVTLQQRQLGCWMCVSVKILPLLHLMKFRRRRRRTRRIVVIFVNKYCDGSCFRHHPNRISLKVLCLGSLKSKLARMWLLWTCRRRNETKRRENKASRWNRIKRICNRRHRFSPITPYQGEGLLELRGGTNGFGKAEGGVEDNSWIHVKAS